LEEGGREGRAAWQACGHGVSRRGRISSAVKLSVWRGVACLNILLFDLVPTISPLGQRATGEQRQPGARHHSATYLSARAYQRQALSPINGTYYRAGDNNSHMILPLPRVRLDNAPHAGAALKFAMLIDTDHAADSLHNSRAAETAATFRGLRLPGRGDWRLL